MTSSSGPSEDELMAIFSSADGDSSYDGWLSLYRAGFLAGFRKAREIGADWQAEVPREDYEQMQRELDDAEAEGTGERTPR